MYARVNVCVPVYVWVSVCLFRAHGKDPVIVSVSLSPEGSRDILIRRNSTQQCITQTLAHGSAFIMAGPVCILHFFGSKSYIGVFLMAFRHRLFSPRVGSRAGEARGAGRVLGSARLTMMFYLFNININGFVLS